MEYNEDLEEEWQEMINHSNNIFKDNINNNTHTKVLCSLLSLFLKIEYGCLALDRKIILQKRFFDSKCGLGTEYYPWYTQKKPYILMMGVWLSKYSHIRPASKRFLCILMIDHS